MGYLIVRAKGKGGPCAGCGGDVEIFSAEAAEARFLIIRLVEVPSLGGGRCLLCEKLYCVSCAVKTIYGKGMRRLHCPDCGSLLAGIEYRGDGGGMGGFLSEPPEFSGREAAPASELEPAGEDDA
jgi:hypothetical protein